MNTVTQQPSQVHQPAVEAVPAIGNSFEAKRPEWMSDDDWRTAFDRLGDVWFDLSQRAARGLSQVYDVHGNVIH